MNKRKITILRVQQVFVTLYVKNNTNKYPVAYHLVGDGEFWSLHDRSFVFTRFGFGVFGH